MAQHTLKKIKYDNTDVAVEVATRDSQGNIIASTYATTTEVASKASQSSVDENTQEISNIKGTITYDLATKEFVNSSIASNTANFKGTFASTSELPTTDVTNNDYAFVTSVDTSGNTLYNRYKYIVKDSGNEWVFEYTLNNSSFTQEQWAAINSGIDSDKVEQYNSWETTLQNKLDIQKDDGVHLYGHNGEDQRCYDLSQSITTDENKIPSSNAVKTELDKKQNEITSTNKLSASNISGLSPVATSGSYDDLTDTPTIPSGDSLVSAQDRANWNLKANQYQISNLQDQINGLSIPTKTSDLTNDSGFITSSDVESDVFIATYGTTTWQECKNALLNNKVIYCNAAIEGFNLFLTGSKQKAVTADIEFYCYATISNVRKLVRASVDTSNVWSSSTDSISSSNYIKDGGNITDLNEATSGFWSISGTTQNSPYNENIFGTLIVGTGAYKPQLLCVSPSGSNDIKMWTRRYKTGTSSWTEWKEVPLTTDIPTSVSELDNDVGYITNSAISDMLTKTEASSTYVAGTADTSATANTIVKRDASGNINGKYIQGTWLKSIDATENASYTDFWVNSNGWLYKRSKANVISDLGIVSEDAINAKINSMSAVFRGSFATKLNLLNAGWQTTDPSGEHFVSNNDYAFVEADESHNGEAWRYLYLEASGWNAQYKVNEVPITEQVISGWGFTKFNGSYNSLTNVPFTSTQIEIEEE